MPEVLISQVWGIKLRKHLFDASFKKGLSSGRWAHSRGTKRAFSGLKSVQETTEFDAAFWSCFIAETELTVQGTQQVTFHTYYLSQVEAVSNQRLHVSVSCQNIVNRRDWNHSQVNDFMY